MKFIGRPHRHNEFVTNIKGKVLGKRKRKSKEAYLEER